MKFYEKIRIKVSVKCVELQVLFETMRKRRVQSNRVPEESIVGESIASSRTLAHPVYKIYTHDELPLIETAEPVSSFVLIHLRRSSSSRSRVPLRSLSKARLIAREIGVSR